MYIHRIMESKLVYLSEHFPVIMVCGAQKVYDLDKNGKKITPKQWKADIQSLPSGYNSIGKEQTKTAV